MKNVIQLSMFAATTFLYAGSLCAQEKAPGTSGTDAEVIQSIVQKRVSVKTEQVDSAKLGKVSDYKLYKASVMIKGDRSPVKKLAFLVGSGNVVQVPEATTDRDMLELSKIFKKDVVLKTEEQAKEILEVLYFVVSSTSGFSRGIEAEVIQDGTTWYLITGKFFKKKKGFVVETDKEGHPTSIKYELGIEK